LVGGETLPSLTDRNNMALCKCPTCGIAWTVNQSQVQMGFDTELKDFLRMLERVRNFEDKLGCQLRFEITSDAVSDRASNGKD
jgi:hypothetical protein